MGIILKMCLPLLQQMPPGTQSVSVLQNLTNMSRGRGTRGVLDWPYPTILDRTPPGRQSSSEDTMRADFLMSQEAHLSDPVPQGKWFRLHGYFLNVTDLFQKHGGCGVLFVLIYISYK